MCCSVFNPRVHYLNLVQDYVNAKVEDLRMLYPKKSQQELEDEAFHHTMYCDEIPDHPLGYGLGVKKGDIYRVRGFLRKKCYGKV